MKKCPLNNFSSCQNDCAWYLPKSQCCSVAKLAKLNSIDALSELKAIQRNLSSIEERINR